MRFLKHAFFLITLVLITGKEADAQAQRLVPPYQNGRTSTLFVSDTLYLGADFVYLRASEQIKVWIDTNFAGWTGALFFYDPKTGTYDSLFTNKDFSSRLCHPNTAPCGAAINLSARHPNIAVGDTIHFMYRLNPGFGNANPDQLPSWTGPNDNASSLYYSQRSMVNPGAPWPNYGRRHSLAGRVNDSVVEFGFEDEGGTGPGGTNSALNGDLDFTDIVFRVSGLFISLEKVATPVANPPATSFNQIALNVSLTDVTSGAVIHYTLDGSTPTASSPIYSGPISITNLTTLKAIALKTGFAPSDILTAVYTKTGLVSSLEILNADTSTLAGGYLTEKSGSYLVRLTTNQGGMASAKPDGSTKTAGDKETLTLINPVTKGNNLVYIGTSPLLIQAATQSNGKTEGAAYDSLIVKWVNPNNPADVAEKHVLIRPFPVQATAWFSQTSGGPAAGQFPISTTTLYIVVKDQIVAAGKTYTAVVTSEAFGIDKETVTLTESPTGSGILIGSIPINQLAAKTQGDGKIEVAVGGDQLKLTYTDPVDGDIATASAGFEQYVQEVPDIQFTDAAGVPLPNGTVWSPAGGKLYFTYSDDYAAGSIPTKQVTLTIAGKKYGVTLATDHEKVGLPMTSGSSGATRATWSGSIDLADAFPPADSNGKAETRYRGEATLSVVSHDNKGVADPGQITDFLIIAYPDAQAAITWKMDTTVTSNEGMIFTITDQTLTPKQPDTVLVTVACTGSGDSVTGFAAIESGAATGTYVTGTLTKDEGVPNLADKILSCQTTDHIRVRYVDPVYGTLTEIIIDEVAKPVATPAGNTFLTSNLVTLTTTTAGAAIYYTLDGSVPKPGVSPLYTDPFRISVTKTLKAIAVKPGMKDSKILTEIYTKKFTASTLEILDENGNAIPNGVLAGVNGDVRVRLITTQDELGTPVINMTTKVSGDAENVPIGNLGSLGNAFEYWQKVDMESPAAKVPGNFTIESAGTDTLIAKWVNPFNPADVAADTIIIKPAFVNAEVYFSTSENGPKVTTYPVGQDSIFIVVKTRPKDPALTYTVTVTTSDLGTDKEVLTLTEVSPGVFTAKAPVGLLGKVQGDKIIEVAPAGDQLTAVFTDPVYKTDFRGDAGFARQVQEAASLVFIDAKGNVVGPTDIWSPDEGKVFLRFTDDWNAGISALVKTKTVRFTLVNRKSGTQIGTDAETATLTLKDSTGTKGTWEGSLTLQDKSTATNNNSVIESYYRGELHAEVTPHDNGGGPSAPLATDDLVIAYPDQPATIIITDNQGGGAVERKTDKVDIVIHDQPMTKSGDATINAIVACAQSGDKVAQVTLVWDATTNAYVIKPPLDKGEVSGTSVDKNDALLLCRESDVLTVTYNDPVYNDTRTADVRWSDDTQAKMYYGSTKDGSPINSVSDAVDKDFTIFIEGKSPTTDKVDTIEVVLTTAQGEKETFKAIETGPFTGKFQVKAEFRFQSGDPAKENGKVEGKITVANRVNQVLVNGVAVISGTEVKADLSMLSTYDLVTRAYIKDEDGNGKADHAYFLFDHKLSRLPTELPEVYWNQVGADFKQKASSAQLSFKGGDSSIVMADFSKSEFGLGLTGIPDGKEAPYGHFPDDNLFAGQKAALSDSVGPVPLTAVKRPSNGLTYSVTATERRFNPDTLVITVSEKLKSTTSFADLLRFSKGCQDYKESVPVKLFIAPTVSPDGLTWTVVVDNALETKTPAVGDCLFLEVDGRYSDLVGNLPGSLGAPLKGNDPVLVIRSFKGYPPVAGIEAGNPGFLVSTHQLPGSTSLDFTKPTNNAGDYEVLWIPPVGYDEKDPVGSLDKISRDFNNNQAGERAGEIGYPHTLPTDISTVQVISLTAYLAKITIYDNLGHFVRSMSQGFGHNGELRNKNRTVEGGQVSFLVWDMKDHTGAKVGQGVFVWKVEFTFTEKNVRSEVRYTRTGVLRR